MVSTNIINANIKVITTVTGEYTFWIAADDNAELWLSTTESENQKVKIASMPHWSRSRQWTRYSQQRSAAITLQAGQKYYIEALQKESWGGDNLAVAWQTPNSALEVIPGSYLSPYTGEDDDCGSDAETGPDHFVISHDNSAAYCLAEPVSVTAYNDQSAIFDSYTGTITLDTQSGSGTWSLVSGAGTFSYAVADDGLATYTYAEGDAGTASFSLYYTNGSNSVDVDVYDGDIRDNDTEGSLQFATTGFSITASALGNPPIVPIIDPLSIQVSGQAFTVHVAAFGTDPDDGTCGIIETYTGNTSLSVSTSYNNPTSGTLRASGSGTINFSAGQASFISQYSDVGQILLTVNDTGAGISGSSNSVVVTPADFSISVSDNP